MPATDLPVLVVGAGLAGVTCARTLADAGRPVRLLERSRRPGGRMASRRTGEGDAERRVDLGASYLTVSDDRFGAQVELWEAAGLVRPWTDTFSVRDVADVDGGWERKSGPLRWGTPGGLRSLVEDLAEGLDLEHREVGAVAEGPDGLRVDGDLADAVVLAMPDPQARRLLAPEVADALGLDDPFEPILALAATWPTRVWQDGPFRDGAFVNGDPDLTWIADDGARRGDDAPVLVAHSTPERARKHLEEPASAVGPLTEALCRVLALDAPADAFVHRWTFAKPTGSRERSHVLTDAGLGVCGDAWSTSAKVESAYLSGLAVAEALLARG